MLTQDPNPPLPVEFWNILHNSISALLNNGTKIVPQLDQIIQPCKNHHEYYVPPKLGPPAEYEAKLPHYIGFTTWLLAQIARATTLESLESQQTQLVDWQILIIESLAYRNQHMFSIILSEYLVAIKDLVESRSKEEVPFEFVWFRKAGVDSQPPLDKFILRSRRACAVLLTHLLKVVRSHTGMLASCHPTGMFDYWSALLALLGDSDRQVWLAALDSISVNIKCDGFPRTSLMVYNLCELLNVRLSGTAGWSGEAGKAMLVSTDTFCEAALSHVSAADKRALSRLYLGLVALLDHKKVVLFAGVSSRSYCKLIVLLFKICPMSVDIKKKVQAVLDHASNFPDILTIVQALVWNDVQPHLNNPEKSRECWEISSLWKSVLDIAAKAVENIINGGQSAANVVKLTKLLSAVALSASNISLQLSQSSSSLVFFGNNFYVKWNKLIREIDLNVIYLEVAKTSKYLASLGDMSMIDLREANSLLAFLSIPWLHKNIGAQLPLVDLSPYRVMANLQIFLDDPGVKSHSLEGLMVMVLCGSLSLDWRLAVFKRADVEIDKVCAMLTTLPVNEQSLCVTSLVDPFFFQDDNYSTPDFASKFPTIVCCLAGTAELIRHDTTDEELTVHCRVCDGNTKDTKFIEDSLATAMLESYLKLRFVKCPSVRKHVASSLKRWSKHIPEPILRQAVDKWLRYIKDDNHDVRMAMAENAAHLVSADSTASFIARYRQVMLALIHKSFSSADCHLQLSLMTTASNVGCTLFENVLLPTLEMFVAFVSHPQSKHELPGLEHLSKIAAARDTSVQDLFFRFQDEIFKYFTIMLIINSLENNDHCTSMLVKLARGFSFTNSKQLWDLSGVKYLLKYLLPLISQDPRAKNMLTPITATTGTDVTSVLKDSFAYVYSHVLLFEDNKTQNFVHQLIEGFAGVSIQSLICYSYKVIICELLLYYHMEKTKVTEALRSLKDCDFGASSSASENLIFSSNSKNDSPNTDITQFLQPRFLAVLAYLDSILVTQSCSEQTKRHALLTLPELIKLYVTTNVIVVQTQFLQPRFLAVLAYLDSILVTQSCSEQTKRHALLTLPELIKLYVTTNVIVLQTQFLQPRFLAVLAYLDSILVTQSCSEKTKRHALLTLPELIKLYVTTNVIVVQTQFLQPRFLAVLAYLDSILVTQSCSEQTKRHALLTLPELIKLYVTTNVIVVQTQFLQPRFLAVLAYLDSILVTQSCSEQTKRHALLTLPELIKLYVTTNVIVVQTQFLQPRFLAVLAYLDSILVTQSCSEQTKRHALLTLPELIKLMGVQHITPVRFKVLATLRYALNLYHSYYPQTICFAWRAFVQNVSSLGPLLSSIFVSLLPLLDQHPVEICSVFRILVVDNLEAVRDHLAELYFLPDTPATHQYYTLVQAELEKLRKLPVKDQLAVTLRLATHKNSDVQLRGLHKLREDLAFHRENLVPLISACDNIDPFILQLLEALLSGCQDTDPDVRLASAQCLGELGALDPGRLPNKFKVEAEEKEMFVISSEAFVLRALNEFVRAFQAASHTTTVDVFAFGIQELLKMYKVPESQVWEKLSDATKEIISPFRESRYKPSDHTDQKTHIPHPIYGTDLCSSLKVWAWNWVSRLIPSVTDEFVRNVFSVCLLGLKKDLQSLLFFLPYIVLHAILGATKSESRRIGEEISAVLFHRGEEDQPTPETCRSIPSTGSLQSTKWTQDGSHTHALCAKTVYQLLDFLYHWLRQRKQQINPSEESTLADQYHKLREFLSTFSKKDIADGSFRCKEYTRALLFLEDYMNENPDLVQSYLPYLGKIYYHLNDPDSFKGIIAIRDEEPTAQEMIHYHKLTGQLQDAAACYERLVQLPDSVSNEDEDFYKGMVQCYLGMDQPSTALQLTQGFLNSMGKCSDMVDEQAEAMLALSMFPQLEQLLTSTGATTTDGWGTALGHALLHLSRGNQDEMVAGLDHIRQALVRNLAGCSLTKSAIGYRHGYDVVVKLHILTELEKVGQMVFKMKGRPVQEMESMFRQVVQKELDDRLKVVQTSYRVLQPILGVRRVVLSLAKDIDPQLQPLFTTEIGNSWLKSIEIARKSGHFQQAYTNILTVEPFKPKGLFVEKARLLWAKSEPEAALNTLKRGVERNFPNMDTDRSGSTQSSDESLQKDERRLCAEAYLLIAQYNDENANIDMDTNLRNYKRAVAVCQSWEKSYVSLAQCYYKCLRSSTQLSQQLECQVQLINMFGKSLQYGCEYIYQSMPRMLSTWLDFGTQLAQDTRKPRGVEGISERKAAMNKMTALVEAYRKRLPTYMFMTAFSQIISRICHPQDGCYEILKAIIIKIIIAYPQQALWMFLSVYKSPYTVRVQRCEEVLKCSEILKKKELNQTINDFRDLFNRLIELGNKNVEGRCSSVNIKTFYRSLYMLVSNPRLSRIVIPLQRFRTISLPRTTAEYHNPFPEDLVYIAGMKEEVVIVPSLQKPKRISLIGTDGKIYSLLCKPNDDLRLDSRMMEFNSIVNMYLQRDPEARERGLYIRTYSAVPLSDSSGIIEWVPNLLGLRHILNSAYKQMGITVTHKEYKECACGKSDPLSKKRAVFLEKLLPRHPPVLRDWYLREFSHPTAWYLARTAYVRTLAVMSIVGYMLGLGDRHGENILIDSTCGDVFHVDFNCLFNRGERFDFPEKVPFRLTHNLVHAMGPTGVEGIFRHSCEITTRVMRQHMDQLMSVVRPFCYDPLVSWNINKNTRDENAEMTNEKAMDDIQNIEMRLQGIVKTKNGSYSVPLSAEGQVRILIAEATDINNLCQMYIGWGPYL
ncbi:serine/threonine-protein kinase ATR-like [Macrosteles quadrilineatus]|uniref:serine/threonine-protein kinase ATR-like n=1 Tax=Macrosteles quadrilineatus TaxID=74068 RepID=UPI0023E27DE3|nr:serine/threonine-protein kinase ATR-like [Macrosteles quadrilineatus]